MTTTRELSVPEIIDLKQVFCLRRKLVKPRKFIYPDGSIYKGETKDGKHHGLGEILYKYNTVIAATWVNGIIEGKGVYMSSILTYRGDFINNEFHGYGKLLYNDDSEYYQGSFKNGRKNGFGKVLFSSGCSYIGEWEEDDINGLGSVCAQGNMYVGIWTKGEQNKGGLIVKNS